MFGLGKFSNRFGMQHLSGRQPLCLIAIQTLLSFAMHRTMAEEEPLLSKLQQQGYI